MKDQPLDFETTALHIGHEPDPSTGSIVTPIHMTSTFAQAGIGEHKGYEYARISNPTRDGLERCVAALEAGAAAAAFASGMAAETAILGTLQPGDGVVAGYNLYGGTFRVLEKIFRPWGLEVAFTHDDSPQAYAEALQRVARPRLVWLETPTNPLLMITDIAAVADVAHAAGAKLVVDNTFATPYLQRPLEMGADYVSHSMSKYLGGHSDLVAGAVVTKTAEDIAPIRYYMRCTGGILSPFESWLVLRGIKTLAVRMDRHCDNAEAVANAVRGMAGVREVYFPGFADHPGHELARRQMKRFGGVVSIRLDGGEPAVRRFLKRLRLFKLAESLGGAESMSNYTATMSHAGLPKEDQLARGIDESLVRLSVGLESPRDLIDDIRQALG